MLTKLAGTEVACDTTTRRSISAEKDKETVLTVADLDEIFANLKERLDAWFARWDASCERLVTLQGSLVARVETFERVQKQGKRDLQHLISQKCYEELPAVKRRR
jgi:hypothetical protein